MAMPIFVFLPTVVVRVAFYAPGPQGARGILCGKKDLPQQKRSKGIEPVVRGDKNLSNCSS